MGLKIIIIFKKNQKYLSYLDNRLVFFFFIFVIDEVVDGDVDNNDEGYEGQNFDQCYGQGVLFFVSDYFYGDVFMGFGGFE